MNNHIGHISVDATAIAKENRVSLLTFPPQCSHELKPLNAGVFGPFKNTTVL